MTEVEATLRMCRELLSEPVNRLVQDARADGGRAIGTTCRYVPEPLLSLDGLVPVRVGAPGVAGTEMADTYLSSVICSYTRSVLEMALAGGYEDLDGWVFTSCCDHLRRLSDNLLYLARPSFHHVLDIPHKRGEAAIDWTVVELRGLADALARSFGIDASEAALDRAIERWNGFVALLKSIGDSRRGEHPPITGTEFHAVLLAAASSPKDALVEPLKRLRASLDERQAARPHRARLMVVGSELHDLAFIEIVESMGGLVVADRFCTGSVPGLDPIPPGDDPFRRLAAHVLEGNSCPHMMEDFAARLDLVLATAREYRADGVVLQVMKFCDCWGVEASPLATALRKAGMPVLRIEREYRLSGEGQLRTRVQAFLESLGR